MPTLADETTLYYYNDNRQVLADYNDAGVLQMWFVYGNYVDEVVMMRRQEGQNWYDCFYVQDHLYSPAALIDAVGGVVERYEYDAYGQPSIMDDSYNPRQTSLCDNPYLFTGRRVDFLDNGNLTLQHNRHRYYDYYTGRWLTEDPLGIDPSGAEQNLFLALLQYGDGLSLYHYAASNPLTWSDPNGTFALTILCLWQVRRAVTNTSGMNDKYRHCYVGCKISFYCSPIYCIDAGILKELVDMAGLGTPEGADLVATFAGCGCGFMPCTCKCCCSLSGYSP